MSEESEELAGSGAPAAPTPAVASRRPVIKKRRRRKDRQEELEQPDEFVEVGGTIVDWVLARGKPIGMVVGGILAVLLVLAVVQKMESGDRLDAAEALYLAKKDLPGSSGPSAPGLVKPDDAARVGELETAVAALGAVATEYEGTPQAALASLHAGSALYREGRYEEALAHFESAATGAGPAAQFAVNSKAYALESLDRVDEAATAFETVRSSARGGAREQATLDLARVYETSGKADQARALYEEFEVEFPESALLADAQARAAALAAK